MKPPGRLARILRDSNRCSYNFVCGRSYVEVQGERLPIRIESQIPVAPLLPRYGVPVGSSMSGLAEIEVGRGTVRLVLVTIVEPM